MVSSQPALTLDSHAYGGLGRRFGAYCVDLVIALSVMAAVVITMRIFRAMGLWGIAGTLHLSQRETPWTPEEIWEAMGVGAKLAVTVGFVLSEGMIYRVLFEASSWQATFGKRLLNIYVTDEGGRRITVARSFGRWSARYFLGLFGGSLLSVATIAGTNDRRALHDWAARTLVMRGRPTRAGTLEVWRVAAAFIVPFAWLVGTFLATL